VLRLVKKKREKKRKRKVRWNMFAEGKSTPRVFRLCGSCIQEGKRRRKGRKGSPIRLCDLLTREEKKPLMKGIRVGEQGGKKKNRVTAHPIRRGRNLAKGKRNRDRRSGLLRSWRKKGGGGGDLLVFARGGKKESP